MSESQEPAPSTPPPSPTILQQADDIPLQEELPLEPIDDPKVESETNEQSEDDWKMSKEEMILEINKLREQAKNKPKPKKKKTTVKSKKKPSVDSERLDRLEEIILQRRPTINQYLREMEDHRIPYPLSYHPPTFFPYPEPFPRPNRRVMFK